MARTWPTRMSDGLAIPFSCWMIRTVVPKRAAIADRVSPGRTVYVRVGEGRAVGPGPGLPSWPEADGAGVAAAAEGDAVAVRTPGGGSEAGGVEVTAPTAALVEGALGAGPDPAGFGPPERETTIATTAPIISIARPAWPARRVQPALHARRDRAGSRTRTVVLAIGRNRREALSWRASVAATNVAQPEWPAVRHSRRCLAMARGDGGSTAVQRCSRAGVARRQPADVAR